jgi:colicin import membrane protein
MSDERADDEFMAKLTAASRAEQPRAGARAKALAAVLAEPQAVQAADAVVPAVPRGGSTWPLLAAAAGFLLVVGVTGGGLVIKHQQDEIAAAKAAADQQAAAAQVQLDTLMAELAAQNERVLAIQDAVQNAKDDAARAAALARLDEAKRQQLATMARATSARSAAGAAPSAAKPASRAACNCTPGDPLCSCIP